MEKYIPDQYLIIIIVINFKFLLKVAHNPINYKPMCHKCKYTKH